MLFYLKGYVKKDNNDYLLVESNDIGYEILKATTKRYEENELDKITIYVYEILKEDSHILIGFNNIQEKNMFLELIKIPGVGIKIGASILKNIPLNILNSCILNSDYSLLCSLPLIGHKLAEQIILHLKDKIKSNNVNNDEKIYLKMIEVSKTLRQFGYKNKDFNPILMNYKNYSLETGEIIKDVIKELSVMYEN